MVLPLQCKIHLVKNLTEQIVIYETTTTTVTAQMQLK